MTSPTPFAGTRSNANGPMPAADEGPVTKTLERVTSRAPSGMFLAVAGLAMAGALGLFFSGRREAGIFVGLWPLAMLSIGNYNKLVKVLGSDKRELEQGAAA